MSLPPSYLQDPHRPASNAMFGNVLGLSRIEASFRNGNIEQMHQWLDAGVLGSLMQGKTRAAKSYHATLPLYLLEAARQAAVEGAFTLSRDDFLAWWERLMGLRSPQLPRPASDWLAAGASLPLPLIDQWVAEGTSPHAHPLSRPTESAFLHLLSDTLVLLRNKGRHARLDWPRFRQTLEQCKKRLGEWVSIPGMSQESANRALILLSRRGLSLDPHEDRAWLCHLRDAVVGQGGYCSQQLMEGVFADECRPPSRSHGASARLSRLATSIDEWEQKRLSDAHQERVVEWLEACFPTAEHPRQAWQDDRRVLSMLLRLPQGGRVGRKMLDGSAHLFDPEKLSAYADAFFSAPDRSVRSVDMLPWRVNRLNALRALRDHPNGPKEEWIIKAARSAMSQSSPEPQEMEAWLSLCDTPVSRQALVEAWMSSMASRPEDPPAKLEAIVQMLHSHGALEWVLCAPGLEEASAQDLTRIRTTWGRWLREEKLATHLRALPEPYGSRVARMHLFFLDPELSVEVMASLVQQGAARAPELVPLALENLLDAFQRPKTHPRVAVAVKELAAFASLPMRLSADRAEGLWCGFGEHLCPRLSGDHHDPALGREAASLLHCLAPLEQARGQPLVEMLRQECSHQASGALARQPPLVSAWAALTPLIDRLVGMGMPLPASLGPDTIVDRPLARQVEASRNQRVLDQATVQVATHRPARRM